MTGKLTYEQKTGLYDFLAGFITDNRKQRFDEIAAFRTRHLTVVLEDIYQSHNASAVLRSCDCFGIQDVHIIENANTYNVNPDVALGSSKWLPLFKYNQKENNTTDCISYLKKKGYTVLAALPHNNDSLIDNVDISKKTAIMFGTEKNGLTEEAINSADGFVKIPMYGFTESFNISVSVAIALYSLSQRLRNSNIHWQLDKNEIIDMKIEWVKNTIQDAISLEKKYVEKIINSK